MYQKNEEFWIQNDEGTVDISPSARFCITEAEIVTALYRGIAEVMKAEAAAK